MKKMIILVFSITMAAGAVYCQKKFDGEINYRVKYEGESITLNLFLQNDKFKIDQAGTAGSSSLMYLGGIAVKLDAGRQIYTEYDDIKDAYKDIIPPVQGMQGLKLSRMKYDKKLFGFSCEKWVLKNEFTSVEMIVTKEALFNPNIIDALPQYTIDWKETVKKENVLPLIVKIKDDLGNTIYTFEAYSISRENIPGEIFTIPKNYQKTENK